MKKSYWLILVFLLWVVMCAVWYILGVKGISTDPAHFEPQPPLIAIIEILVMMVGAFIIGFGLAWLLREETIGSIKAALRELQYDHDTQRGILEATRHDYERTHRKLLEAEEKIGHQVAEKERLMQQVETGNRQVQKDIQQVKESEAKARQLEGEITSLKFRVRLLENEVSEKDKQLTDLREESSARPKANHRDWSDHPFVRPTEMAVDNEKDDLTQIKGIGPRFQQKLNSLDIFSFRQISELSGEAVERLAEVIEVFPDRIHRDNWIGQATKLYLKKTSRE